jgi:DNA-binding GntR family transcriptional regulator
MTIADHIRSELADQILTGRRLPGTALDEQSLAAEFGASRTPVREAIRLLAASGLVAHRPRRGAEVVAPSRSELIETFQVMADLEALCAGYSSLQMSNAERRNLSDMHDRMALIVQGGAKDAYSSANETFHGLIYAGSHNRYLAELTLTTRQRLRPFRRAQFQTLGRLAASHLEHGTIVEAILRGDRSAAERSMQRHIADVRDAWLGMSPAATGPAGI